MTDSRLGRDAEAPFQIPLGGWWQVLRRTAQQVGEDNVDIVAAGVAFYGFLALVPLLAAMVLTYGLVIDPAAAAAQIHQLARLVPSDVLGIIDDQLKAIVQAATDAKGLGLIAALGIAFYGAMKGAAAIITAVNIAYGEANNRGLVGSTLLGAAMTLGAILLALLFFAAAALTTYLELAITGLGALAILVAKLLAWLGTAAVATLGLVLLYRFAPARRRAKWRWLMPGALTAMVGIGAASLGFGWYAANFGNYNATYGALGAVVVMLLWLYLSAYAVILGAELNAELEHQTARDSTRGPDRPLGQRRARMADTVAGDPVGIQGRA